MRTKYMWRIFSTIVKVNSLCNYFDWKMCWLLVALATAQAAHEVNIQLNDYTVNDLARRKNRATKVHDCCMTFNLSQCRRPCAAKAVAVCCCCCFSYTSNVLSGICFRFLLFTIHHILCPKMLTELNWCTTSPFRSFSAVSMITCTSQHFCIR